MIKSIIYNIEELKTKSEEANKNRINGIVDLLEKELSKHKNGIGLSGIQIGIPEKVAIIRIPQQKISIDLINAKIIEKYDRFMMKNEGCLSLPGIYVDTIRYKEVEIENNGKRFIYTLEEDGVICIAIQHEIEHMNGRTILDSKWKRR